MTRHQRRKLARARKDANAERINSRALALLHDELRKRNLMERKGKRSNVRLNASSWLEGYSTHGADGSKTMASEGTAVRNRKGGKTIKGNHAFDWSQVRDDYALAGERITSGYARKRYEGCVPNCERADFKGPFVRKG